ncbi:MAG TPA: DUF4293 domain-containing protein [Chitinophagales bacterium]|nr:DUF4293 domain-containing protein [Chitinophagales bacterium]
MIQRIQTVFLLLAIIAMGLLLFLPLVSVETQHFTNSTKGYEIGHTLPIASVPYIIFFNAIMLGTAMGFTLIAIFLFKKRSLQMLFCWFAIVLITSAAAFVFYKFQTKVFIGDVIYRKWNIFSLVAVVLEILAIVYIRKDENTIRSLDRLR